MKKASSNTFNVALLKKIPIFSTFSDSQFQFILKEKIVVNYTKGTYIFHEGNNVDGCYIIISGVIKISKLRIDGREQILQLAKPYDIIGYHTLFNNDLTYFTAKTLQDCTLLFIPRDSFITLTKSNFSLIGELFHSCCNELYKSNNAIINYMHKSVKERLWDLLLNIKMDFGVDKENFNKLYLTREEFANILGTSTETVIRLLSELKKENLIEIDKKKIKLLNFAKPSQTKKFT